MLAFMSPSPAIFPPAPPPVPSLKRPRGLWKQRRLEPVQTLHPFPWPLKEVPSHVRTSGGNTAPGSPRPSASGSPTPSVVHLRSPSSSSHRSLTASPDDDCTYDDDEDDARSVSSSSSKRRRVSGHFSPGPDFAPSRSSGSAPGIRCESITPLSGTLPHYAATVAPLGLPPLLSLSMFPQPVSRSISAVSAISSSSSTSAKGKHRLDSVQPSVHSADYEDWENLKELFARAAERYDGMCLPAHPHFVPTCTFLFRYRPSARVLRLVLFR